MVSEHPVQTYLVELVAMGNTRNSATNWVPLNALEYVCKLLESPSYGTKWLFTHT